MLHNNKKTQLQSSNVKLCTFWINFPEIKAKKAHELSWNIKKMWHAPWNLFSSVVISVDSKGKGRYCNEYLKARKDTFRTTILKLYAWNFNSPAQFAGEIYNKLEKMKNWPRNNFFGAVKRRNGFKSLKLSKSTSMTPYQVCIPNFNFLAQ